jgi:Domain of unknown function (DUF4332)
MPVNWDEFQKTLFPIKNFEEAIKHMRVSFGYAFVVERFNLSMTELIKYTHELLGGDARGRYVDYEGQIVRILSTLQRAGVNSVLELKSRIESPEALEAFIRQSGMDGRDIASVLKYLIYWFIPREKYLSGLVRDDPETGNAVKILQGKSIRTNLELLERGIRSVGRKAVAEISGLPEEVITALVNRADFSRLPWASKATISNIIGAGYGSMEKLANANPDQLYEDFFRYGKSIGKNLKLGNEIESSYRVAKIVPKIVE